MFVQIFPSLVFVVFVLITSLFILKKNKGSTVISGYLNKLLKIFRN